MTVIVQRDQYAGMALLYDFGWMYSEIGRLWGIGRHSVQRAVAAWKEDRVPAETIAESHRAGGSKSRARFKDWDDEVRAYLLTYRDATVHDVSLECNMSDNMACRLMRKVRAE